MRKIKFNEITFRNFLSYGNNWQTFKFNNGLNIIQGVISESGKSNGSGKSSITELIPFALYGRTIKKINKAKIVNWYNEKRCEVQLLFTVDGVDHKIVRGIKPNKLELWIDGNEQPKLASVTDFQSQIEEDIIGMDFQTFQNLIYFSPNNTISIINAGKPEKRKFLESLFDLSVYSKMGKTTNEKLSSNDKKMAVLNQELINFDNHITTLQNFLDNQTEPNILKYKTKLTGLKMQYDELFNKTFDVSDDAISILKGVIQKSKDTLSEWKEIYLKSKSLIDLHRTIIEKIGNLDDAKQKRIDIQKQIDGIKVDDKEIDKLENQITDLTQKKELMKEELKDYVSIIQGTVTEISICESKIREINDDIVSEEENDTPTEGICDFCKQTIDGDVLEQTKQNKLKSLYDLKEKQEKKIDHIQKEKGKLDKKKERLFQKTKDESDGIKDIMEVVEDLRKKKDTLKRLQERLKDLPDTKEDQKTIDEGNKIIEKESKEALEYEGKINLAEMDIERYTEQYEDLIKIDDLRKQNESEMKTLRVQIDSTNDTIKEYNKMIKKIKQDRKDKEKEIDDTRKQKEKTIAQIVSSNNLIDYLNYLKVSLKDENVKRFAISSLIPYLNQQTNYYLSESGFPYVVTVDSWLDVNIRGLGVEDVSYGSLSGGETKCIDISIQLACNDIASMMAKTSLNFMVLDEVLDTSVDGLGVQSLINIIRVRQETNNDSVYIITHRTEVDEFTFDSVVRIIQENKFSRVEVE